MFLKSIEYQLWIMVEKWYISCAITFEGVKIPKTEDKWMKKMKRDFFNVKCIGLCFSSDEINRVDSCDTPNKFGTF